MASQWWSDFFFGAKWAGYSIEDIVADPHYEARGSIASVDPENGDMTHISVPDMQVTNICFGGPDLTTAYVTLCQKGTLSRFTWPVPELRSLSAPTTPPTKA